MRKSSRSSIAAVALLGIGSVARAAGGQLDVDDAVMPEPGRCRHETGLLRSAEAATSLFHAGRRRRRARMRSA